MYHNLIVPKILISNDLEFVVNYEFGTAVECEQRCLLV